MAFQTAFLYVKKTITLTSRLSTFEGAYRGTANKQGKNQSRHRRRNGLHRRRAAAPAGCTPLRRGGGGHQPQRGGHRAGRLFPQPARRVRRPELCRARRRAAVRVRRSVFRHPQRRGDERSARPARKRRARDRPVGRLPPERPGRMGKMVRHETPKPRLGGAGRVRADRTQSRRRRPSAPGRQPRLLSHLRVAGTRSPVAGGRAARGHAADCRLQIGRVGRGA